MGAAHAFGVVPPGPWLRPGPPKAWHPATDNEAGPGVSELAEKIKTLKAANSIEVTPQRVRPKQSSAEEPVTARIRRRTEANPASDQAVEPDGVSGAGEGLPPEARENPSGKEPLTFQERIAMERRPKEDGPAPTR